MCFSRFVESKCLLTKGSRGYIRMYKIYIVFYITALKYQKLYFYISPSPIIHFWLMEKTHETFLMRIPEILKDLQA